MPDSTHSAEELFAEFISRIEQGEDLVLDSWIEEQDARFRPRLRALAEVNRQLDQEFLGDLADGEPPAVPAGKPDRSNAQACLGDVVGDYRLLRLIASGGMGQVWDAEQLSLRRRVALKLMRPEKVNGHSLRFFAREARAGGRLHHPGIVTVHGWGESDGLAWIAMEHIEGERTLFDFLEDAKRLDQLPPDYDRRVARIVADLADALQAAHDAGVTHRDLKPKNILLALQDRPLVTDFGLARIADESAISETGDFAGTYFYMSPEQVAARRAGIDHRTDVFSLAVVLYELLTLQRPFQGDTTHQVAAQILAKDPPDPRTIRSRVPRDLAVIAGRAMEKDRDRRFQSMRELADDLRRFLGNEPILATPPTISERAVKWAKRNPTRSAIAGVAGLALIIISVLFVRLFRTSHSLVETTKRFVRVSTDQRVEDLKTEADQLWPLREELIGDYERWIEEAKALVNDLPQYRGEQEELRGRALYDEHTKAEVAQQGSTASDTTEERLWFDRFSLDQLTQMIEALEELTDPETGLLALDGISPEHGWTLMLQSQDAPSAAFAA